MLLNRPSYFLRKYSKNEGANFSSEELLGIVLLEDEGWVREYGEDAGDGDDYGESKNYCC